MVLKKIAFAAALGLGTLSAHAAPPNIGTLVPQALEAFGPLAEPLLSPLLSITAPIATDAIPALVPLASSGLGIIAGPINLFEGALGLALPPSLPGLE